jgi:hypothetical protein
MHALAGLAFGYGFAIWWDTGNPSDWLAGALCLALAVWMPIAKSRSAT